jgi:hypothetical protein
MSEKVTLAFLIPSIIGHANVHLAILRRLLAREASDTGEIHVHVIGDGPLRKHILSLPKSDQCFVYFHLMFEEDLLMSLGDGKMHRLPPLSLFSRAGLSTLDGICQAFAPAPDAFIPRFHRIVEVLRKVKPQLMVIDMLVNTLGVDSAKHVGVPYVTISPGSSLDMSIFDQPGGRVLWKYPM